MDFQIENETLSSNLTILNESWNYSLQGRAIFILLLIKIIHFIYIYIYIANEEKTCISHPDYPVLQTCFKFKIGNSQAILISYIKYETCNEEENNSCYKECLDSSDDNCQVNCLDNEDENNCIIHLFKSRLLFKTFKFNLKVWQYL